MNNRIPREGERFCFYDVVTLGYMQPELTVCIIYWKLNMGKYVCHTKKGVVGLSMILDWHAPLRLICS